MFTLIEESPDDAEKYPYNDEDGCDDEVGADDVWFHLRLRSTMKSKASRACALLKPRMETPLIQQIENGARAFIRPGSGCAAAGSTEVIRSPIIQQQDIDRSGRTIRGEAHHRFHVTRAACPAVVPDPAAVNEPGWRAVPERSRAIKGARPFVGQLSGECPGLVGVQCGGAVCPRGAAAGQRQNQWKEVSCSHSARTVRDSIGG